MKRTIVLVLCLLLAVVLSANGQVPEKISYQGLLTTSAGTPVQNGNYNLKFDIYTLPAGGTLQYTETQNNVPLQKGTFNVVLRPSSTIFVDSLYVEVTALAGPGISSPVTFSPRSELTSVPYALAPWSIIGSDIAYATGNVLIGPPTPFGKLNVQTAGPFTPGIPAAPTRMTVGFGGTYLALGSDPVGALAQGFMPDMATPSPLTLQQFGGNVGVGWPPTYTLDVNGTGRFIGPIYFGAGATEGIRDSSGFMQYKDQTTGWISFANLGGGGPANAWLLNGNAIAAGNFLGTTNNMALILKANNLLVSTFTPIGGTATIVGGFTGNIGPTTGSTISGGGDGLNGPNRALDDYGTVSGGSNNQVGNGGIPTDARFATVGGGLSNIAAGPTSTIGGGMGNTAQGQSATIAGGDQNVANAIHATVGGGWMNNSGQKFSTVGGGFNNNMTLGPIGGADTTVIGGGGWNDVFDNSGTVSGGTHNIAGSNDGLPNTNTHATVGGGYNNQSTGSYSTIGGGENNVAGSLDGTIGGGAENVVGPGSGTTVGGGLSNTAGQTGSTVAGGIDNVSGPLPGSTAATVGGGQQNQAMSNYSTVSGGFQNVASGPFSTIPGGESNQATMDHTLAAGWLAQAVNSGAFVWADAQGIPFASTGNNQFAVRANGGAYFEVTTGLPNRWVNIFNDGVNLITTSTGARLTLAGVWTNVSDRTKKENFVRVDGRELLEKLSTLPITMWNFKSDSPEIRHIGPMAQDFYQIFGLGDDEKSISSVDPSGVALAAIQQLYKENMELKARVEKLEAAIQSLGVRLQGGSDKSLGELR